MFVAAMAVIAIVIVAVIFAGILMGLRPYRDMRREFLQSTARRLKGTFVEGGGLSRDRILVTVCGVQAPVEFEPVGEESSGRTAVTIPLDGPSPGTLHIVPDGFGQSFLKMFGAQDLSIGDRSFDAQYVVKATPESLAAEVFRSDRRERMMAAVRRLSQFANPTIDLTRTGLRIQVREELKSEASVLALLKTAEEFLEVLRVAVPVPGIHLGEMKTSRDSACPVCGTSLGGHAVRCESCRTPHHPECWSYVGQCSTYACQGKRSVA